MDSSVSVLPHDRRRGTWLSIAAALSFMFSGGLVAWRGAHAPATVADAGVFVTCVLTLCWIARLLQHIALPAQARTVQ